MNDLRQTTVDTYNKSAKALADYFRGIGSRKDDIMTAIKLAGNPSQPKILEIGCGDGRDAAEAIKITQNYTGFDISKELISLARKRLPGVKFEVADAVGYNYQTNLDVVLAFASLLHLNKTEVAEVLDSVHSSLRSGGVLFISLKYAPSYSQKVKIDEFGERLFYFYNPEIIENLAGKRYKLIKLDDSFVTGKKTKWFDLVLIKK